MVLGTLVISLIIVTTFRSLIAPIAPLVAVVAAALAVAMIVRVGPRSIGVGSIYASLFVAFHCGILFSIAFGGDAPVFRTRDLQWVFSNYFSDAAVMVAVAALSLALGYAVTTGWRARWAGSLRAAVRVSSRPDGPGVLGVLVLIVGLGIWVRVLLGTGASVTDGYGDFLGATAGSLTPLAYSFVTAGMALVAGSLHRGSRIVGLTMFGSWMVPAFYVGLRGEVVVPLVVYLVVAARSRPKHVRVKAIAIGAIALLSLGSMVRVLRGPGGLQDFTWSDANPLLGIAELGYSIRPLVAVETFHGAGEPFVGIATYLAPFRRVIEGRVLGLSTVPAEQDMNVFSTMIASRVGPIGGSPVAEAYRAGGVLWVLGAMFLIGSICALLDSATLSPITNVFVGLLAGVLFLWVRNDFTPVPTSVVLALGLTGVASVIDRTQRKCGPTGLHRRPGLRRARARSDAEP